MNPRRIVPRALAEQDVLDAVDFYLAEAGEKAALKFIDALERAYRLIAERPNVGSSRYAHDLDLPELRGWGLRGFPYIIFYVPRGDHIDVWRVMHAATDIPAWMQEPP